MFDVYLTSFECFRTSEVSKSHLLDFIDLLNKDILCLISVHTPLFFFFFFIAFITVSIQISILLWFCMPVAMVSLQIYLQNVERVAGIKSFLCHMYYSMKLGGLHESLYPKQFAMSHTGQRIIKSNNVLPLHTITL